MLRFPQAWGNPYDWRYFETTEEIARKTVAVYHEAPLWNPYMCGGEVGLANPQSTATAPTFLLTLLFGTALGIKLALVVYLFCALDGAARLARLLGVSFAGSLVSGLTYAGAGWFVMHLSSGHINFAGATLYPYLLLCYRRAVDERWRWALPGGALLAWMAALGGTYTLPMAVVLLGTVAITDAVRARSARPIAIAPGIGIAALLVGAVRLLPALEFAVRHPRHVPEKDAMSLVDLGRALFEWHNKLSPFGNHTYWWHEYCCHIAYAATGLAVIVALQHVRRRDLIPLAIAAAWGLLGLALPSLDARLGRFIGYADLYWLTWAVAFWYATRRAPEVVRRFVPLVLVALGIAVGKGWPHGPWWLLRQLPLYRDLRVPPRYLILVALVAAVWAGAGLDALLAWWARRGRAGGSRLAWLLVAATGIEVVAFAYPAWQDVFTVVQVVPRQQGVFHQEQGDLRWMFSSVLRNEGVLDCDEEAPLQRAEALDAGPGEQVRLLDPAAGTASLARWSPDRVEVGVELTRATTLLVNENWNEHWHVDGDGGEVTSVAGRLAVRLPATARRVALVYRPRSFVAGAWLSAVALPLAIVLFVGMRRRRDGATG